MFSHNCDQYLGRHSRPGDGLVVLEDWRTDRIKSTMLLKGKLPEGATHHPDLSYDAMRILFGFCDHTSPEKFFYIYEAAADGSSVKQLTGTPRDRLATWDDKATVFVEDFDPCYLPDGGFAFVSTRCQGFGRCHGGRYTPSYLLYRADGDGSNIRPMSYGEANEHEPAVLADGRVVYTRWDYINRNQIAYHKLWWCRPDGTNPSNFYGNNSATPWGFNYHDGPHPDWYENHPDYGRFLPFMISETKAIPGTRKVVATAQSHHSYTHGTLVIVDPDKGEDGFEPLSKLTPETPYPESEDTFVTPGNFISPYPINEELYLAGYSPWRVDSQHIHTKRANSHAIYLVDSFGGRELIYRDPAVACVSPIPMRPRKKPPVIHSVLPEKPNDTGTYVVQDVYLTRNDPERKIKKGDIKFLRVNRIMNLPSARQVHPGTSEETAKRILGTVPVNDDGSAMFRVPARVALQLQALDKDGMAILTERTFNYVHPGEVRACIGCHEGEVGTMASTARGRAAVAACITAAALSMGTAAASEAGRIIGASGVKGGLVVHLGCGTGELTAGLRAGDGYLVQGLNTDPAKVAAARKRIAGLGLYGPVSVDTFDGERLPYVDGLVNLIVSEGPTGLPQAEVMRCLAPLGVAMIDGRKTVKPWPDNIDEWTHYLHGPDNNAVANDTVVGPPRHYQWQGGPRWARHHDHMASMSALVTSHGRLFYVFDEGSTASLLLPSKWALIARDAFSGVVLWKRRIDSWYKRTYRLKGGPADAPRRLVASATEVYVPLGLDAPLSAVSVTTGEVLRTYAGTRATEEVLLSDGTLFLVVNPDFRAPANLKAERPGGERKLMAFDAASGRKLWEHGDVIAAMTPAVDGEGVYYFNRKSIVSLDRLTGREQWRSDPLPTPKRFTYFFAMSLVVKDGVILLASGEQSGVTRSGGGCTKSDSLAALSAETGAVLWKAEHGPSGYSSPEDLFVIDGVAWSSAVSNGVLPGTVTGHDLRTGKVRSRFDEDVKTYWFHHRCYPGKATVKYLMPARTGTEFIDIRKEHWDINHFVRGGCIYGVMPANGFLYTPMHPCICYSESKLFGMNALAAASPSRSVPRDVDPNGRLELGPAFGTAQEGRVTDADWPTYRHDPSRSGATEAAVPSALREVWRKKLGGKLTSMTAAGGMLFVAEPDRHAVKALDVATGEVIWSRTVGGAGRLAADVARGTRHLRLRRRMGILPAGLRRRDGVALPRGAN